MKWVVIDWNVKPNLKTGDELHLYPDNGSQTYGPLVKHIPKIYYSRNRYAKKELAAVADEEQKRLASKGISAKVVPRQYSQTLGVLHLLSDKKISDPSFIPLGPTDYFRAFFRFPEHELALDEQIEKALQIQLEVNTAFREILNQLLPFERKTVLKTLRRLGRGKNKPDIFLDSKTREIIEKSAQLENLLMINPRRYAVVDFEEARCKVYAEDLNLNAANKNPEVFSLEQLLSRTAGVDIEMTRYKTAEPEVFLVSICTPEDNVQHGILEQGNSVTKSESCNASYVMHENQSRVRRDAANELFARNILFPGGNNFQGYDMKKLLNPKRTGEFKAEKDGIFIPAVDNQEPVYLGKHGEGMGEFEKFGYFGGIPFDLLNFSKAYLGAFLIDFKLETILEFAGNFFGTGYVFKKPVGYTALEELVEAARAGDKEKAAFANSYGLEDTHASLVALQALLPIARKIAIASGSEYIYAINSFRKRLVLNSIQSRYLKTLNVPMPLQQLTAYEDCHVREKQRELCRNSMLDCKKGFFNEAVVCFIPIFSSNAVKWNKDLALGKKIYDESVHPIEKVCLGELLEEFALQPLADIKRDCPEKFYYGRYGMGKEKLEQVMQEQTSLLSSLKDDYINSSGGIFFLKGNAPKEAVVVGRASVVSIAEGVAVYKIGNVVLASGIRIPSPKKRFSEDLEPSSLFERELEYDFVREVFVAPETALQHIVEKAQRLENGGYTIENFLERFTAGKSYDEYSEKGMATKRYEVVSFFKLKQGDEITYYWADDNGLVVPCRWNGCVEKPVSVKTYKDAVVGKSSVVAICMAMGLKLDLNKNSIDNPVLSGP